MNKKNIAFIYDFDGTLTLQDSMSYGVFPALNMDITDFWQKADQLGKSHQIDPHSAGLLYLKQCAEARNISLTRCWFAKQAEKIEFCMGLHDEWFGHFNHLADQLGLNIHHYIISAGQSEIIKACTIAHAFRDIYANSFFYDDEGNGKALWPAHIVNSTNKLQFLFRIHKGVFDLSHYTELYQYMLKEERFVPFENIIFIGDGETDVPCMRVTKRRGGLALSVYPNQTYYPVAQKLYDQGRVHACFKADYRYQSPLTQYITSHLQKRALDITLQ